LLTPREDPAATRGPRPRGAAVRRRDRRPATHRDWPSMQTRRRPAVLAARPPAPTYQPAARSGPVVGGDRPVRRPEEAVDHGRHVHARDERRRGARLLRAWRAPEVAADGRPQRDRAGTHCEAECRHVE